MGWGGVISRTCRTRTHALPCAPSLLLWARVGLAAPLSNSFVRGRRRRWWKKRWGLHLVRCDGDAARPLRDAGLAPVAEPLVARGGHGRLASWQGGREGGK